MSALAPFAAQPVGHLNRLERAAEQPALGQRAALGGEEVLLDGLSDALGMTTVAEGVEQPVQQHFLAAQGCPLSQGRLFGGALPPLEMTDRLRKERT